MFNSIISDWRVYSLLESEAGKLETLINYMTFFDSYEEDYNTSITFNLTITSEFVNFTSNNLNTVFVNAYDMPNLNLVGLKNINLRRSDGVWFFD
jgi:hypothetical protein